MDGNAVTQVPHDVISIRPQTNKNSPTAKTLFGNGATLSYNSIR